MIFHFALFSIEVIALLCWVVFFNYSVKKGNFCSFIIALFFIFFAGANVVYELIAGIYFGLIQ